MRTTTAVALIAAALLALAGCGSDQKPDTAACKTAMAKQLDQAITDGDQAKEGDRPAACDGVDTNTLQRLAGELTTEKAGDAVEDAAEDATAQPSAECRAWIETELLDSTSTIDATSGMDVCGDLTEAELDKLIEDVTNDLSTQDTTP